MSLDIGERAKAKVALERNEISLLRSIGRLMADIDPWRVVYSDNFTIKSLCGYCEQCKIIYDRKTGEKTTSIPHSNNCAWGLAELWSNKHSDPEAAIEMLLTNLNSNKQKKED